MLYLLDISMLQYCGGFQGLSTAVISESLAGYFTPYAWLKDGSSVKAFGMGMQTSSRLM